MDIEVQRAGRSIAQRFWFDDQSERRSISYGMGTPLRNRRMALVQCGAATHGDLVFEFRIKGTTYPKNVWLK
jgi:hypothetical protein